MRVVFDTDAIKKRVANVAESATKVKPSDKLKASASKTFDLACEHMHGIVTGATAVILGVEVLEDDDPSEVVEDYPYR